MQIKQERALAIQRAIIEVIAREMGPKGAITRAATQSLVEHLAEHEQNGEIELISLLKGCVEGTARSVRMTGMASLEREVLNAAEMATVKAEIKADKEEKAKKPNYTVGRTPGGEISDPETRVVVIADEGGREVELNQEQKAELESLFARLGLINPDAPATVH